MEPLDGKSSVSTSLKSGLYALYVGTWLHRWITSFRSKRATTSGTRTTSKHSARPAIAERPRPTTGDLETSVVMSDCPLCGLPAELRESFPYRDGRTRVVILCPLDHAVAADGEELDWYDPFE